MRTFSNELSVYLAPELSSNNQGHNINRRDLLKMCGLPARLPEGGGLWHGVPCYGWGGKARGHFLGVFQVRMIPQTPGTRGHRLFVACKCNKWVPAGRYGQHKCSAKVETL